MRQLCRHSIDLSVLDKLAEAARSRVLTSCPRCTQHHHSYSLLAQGCVPFASILCYPASYSSCSCLTAAWAHAASFPLCRHTTVQGTSASDRCKVCRLLTSHSYLAAPGMGCIHAVQAACMYACHIRRHQPACQNPKELYAAAACLSKDFQHIQIAVHIELVSHIIAGHGHRNIPFLQLVHCLQQRIDAAMSRLLY